MASLKFSELFSFAWSFTNGKIIEYYRQYFSEVVTVLTKSGPVKGYKMPSSFEYQYINFFGIPYAKPPVGDLRFKDPQPFEPSNDVINMQFHRSGSMACQTDVVSQRQVGAENCLHLSVFTRDIKPDVLKPVMVWIHGGAFILGSNSKDIFNPEFLLRNDVVVITINYRLGAIGFLSFSDPDLKIPGNAGLKDQCMALKWVKENCHDFGGDSNNITIFGESAGGASVHFHMMSEMSNGLFHKAIAMSGTVYSPWAVSTVKDWAQRLGRKLGWNGEGGEKACLAVIQNASSESITKTQESILTLEDRKRYVFFTFGPVIEPYESEQCFLSKDPKLIARNNAWSKNIPMIIGGCSDEGLLFHKMLMKKPSTLKKVNLANAVPFQEFGLNAESEICQELGESIKKFYFGFSSLSADTIWTYLMLLGDKLFVHPTHRSLLARVNSSRAATYLYRFNFDSYAFSLTKKIFAGKNAEGACHADDCSYIFKNLFSHVPARNTTEWKTIERMCECWTQFARTGNPNNDIIAPVEWKPVELNEKPADKIVYKCLNFANDVSLIDAPELERMHFWDDLYKKNNSEIY